jgi:hypothetical protein
MCRLLKKIRIKNLEKRIKQLEYNIALCEEEYGVEDMENGSPPDPYLSKKRAELGRLRRKLDDLNIN